jgi:hypothetical protein
MKALNGQSLVSITEDRVDVIREGVSFYKDLGRAEVLCIKGVAEILREGRVQRIHLGKEVKNAFELNGKVFLVYSNSVDILVGESVVAKDLPFAYLDCTLVEKTFVFSGPRSIYGVDERMKRRARTKWKKGYIGRVFGNKNLIVYEMNSRRIFVYGRDGRAVREVDVGFQVFDCQQLGSICVIAGNCRDIIVYDIEKNYMRKVETPHSSGIRRLFCREEGGGITIVSACENEMFHVFLEKEGGSKIG